MIKPTQVLKNRAGVPWRSVVATGLVLAAFLSETFSSGEETPWISKQPGDWTLQDAEAVLWHSPWVKLKPLRFFGSQGRTREVKLWVRIQSARPVRLALAEAYLMQPEGHVYQSKRVARDKIEEIAGQIRIPGEIVFAVVAYPPPFHRRLNEQDSRALHQNTYLQVGKTRIALKRFVPPERSAFGEAWFRFPRPDLDTYSGKIQFHSTLKVPWDFKFGVSFSPKDMIFQGEHSY